MLKRLRPSPSRRVVRRVWRPRSSPLTRTRTAAADRHRRDTDYRVVGIDGGLQTQLAIRQPVGLLMMRQWPAAPVTPGSNNSVSNNQCAISGTGGSNLAQGNTLTLNAPVTFRTGVFRHQADVICTPVISIRAPTPAGKIWGRGWSRRRRILIDFGLSEWPNGQGGRISDP